jgi:hypothetical protein
MLRSPVSSAETSSGQASPFGRRAFAIAPHLPTTLNFDLHYCCTLRLQRLKKGLRRLRQRPVGRYLFLVECKVVAPGFWSKNTNGRNTSCFIFRSKELSSSTWGVICNSFLGRVINILQIHLNLIWCRAWSLDPLTLQLSSNISQLKVTNLWTKHTVNYQNSMQLMDPNSNSVKLSS